MKTIYVQNNTNSILNYIKNSFPNLPISALHKALRNKDIRVNDKKISSNIGLNINDKIDIYISDNVLFNLPKSLNYIYIDDNILVVFKPQGILSNNENINTNITKSNFILEPTLEDLVKKNYNNALICHRLDRNTAGLLIFALNKSSYNEIMEAFKNNLIQKEYIAYVNGSLFNKNRDTLKGFITKDNKNGLCKFYKENVKNAIPISTYYEVLYKNNKLDYAILKIRIHNGKTHQIRVHMQSISHPIIR